MSAYVSRVCRGEDHPPHGEHPGCSGCRCQCHPRNHRRAPRDFRAQVEAAREQARARTDQEDTTDA